MRVKGTMILDYVRIIRANRDKDWSQYLTPEDWELIDGQILPSNWYSYESFRRIAFGVYKVIAGGNLQTAQSFGRFTIRNQLEVYKNLLVPGDPVASVDMLARLRRTFFEGEADAGIIAHGKGWLDFEVVAASLADEKEPLQAYCHLLAGIMLELVEQAGGKNAKTQVSPKPGGAEIKLTWE